MGDIAEMILDGTLCMTCGIYIGDSGGFPVECENCSGTSNEKQAYFE